MRQKYVTLGGEPIEGETEGTPLYVMAKDDGRRRLVACQNTAVLDA